MFALTMALRSGAEMFELDAHATADGFLVVMHDADVDRCTNGTGRIDTLSLDELRRLDAGYWFEPGVGVTAGRPPAVYKLRGVATGDVDPPDGFAPSDFTVPTLDEVLERFPDVPVNVDIKQTEPDTRPYEAQLAEVLRRTGRSSSVMVASFSDAALGQFRSLAPEVATSAGPDEVLAFYTAVDQHGRAPSDVAYQALQVPEQFGDVTVVTRAFVEAAHRAGLAVHVWTVDEPDAMHRLLDLGVDGIVTDRPSVLRSVLDARQ